MSVRSKLTEPRTTAPVYLKGSLAAIPYTVFWYTPLATVNKGQMLTNLFFAQGEQQPTVQNSNGAHGDAEKCLGPRRGVDHGQHDCQDEDDHLDHQTPDNSRRQIATALTEKKSD